MSNMHRDDEGEFLPARQVRPLPAAYEKPPQQLTGAISETDDVALVMHYLRLLWKRKGILLLCTTLGIVAGFAKSLWTTPLYYARTSLEISNLQEPINGNAPGGLDLGTKALELKSNELAGRVQTKLAERTLAPSDRQDPLLPLRRFLGLSDPAQSIDWKTGVSWAASERKVLQSGPDTRIVFIESKSPDPQAAAEFTNALAEEYIEKGKRERSESYREQGEWLNTSQAGLRARVEDSERRLREFAKTNGLIVTGSEDATEEKFKQLQAQLGQAFNERIAKQAKYEASTNPAKSESLPEIIDSGPIGSIQAKLAALYTERAKLRATLTDNHTKVEQIQAQINQLEDEKEGERKSIFQRIKIEYEVAKNQEDRLDKELRNQVQIVTNLGEPLLQYKMLLAEVEMNKRLYEQVTAQGTQLNLASSLRASNARILDRAKAAAVPMTPNWPLDAGLGGIGGIFCGTVLLIGLSLIDARIQDRGFVQMQLGLRELGVIPSASISALQTGQTLYRSLKHNAQADSNKNPISILIPKKGASEALELVTWTHRSSVISEAVRAVMTSILFSSNGHAPQTLLITSPNKQEGKTTVITNLAIALAEINRRVLLIDADMRLPRIHQIFDLPNTYGLSDFLHERRPIEEYQEEELVRKTPVPNLHVMLAGPARSNLARLLYSSRMKELILRFRGTFDTILIDSAPVLSVADARILGRSADGIILVIRAHRTHQEAAVAAVRCFEEDGSRILGTIFNDWNPKRSTYGNYGGYGAYGGYGN